MSRCYPFPPPGFVPNQVRDVSLIEPIKKGTKMEIKREKRDIKKHNKDKKRKDRGSEDGRSREHHRHHKRQRQCKDEIIANASKKVDDDNDLECLEKSCLTMELDHQTSSENEGPNRVQSHPLNGRHNNDSGEFVCLLVVGSVLLHVLATMMTLFLQIVAMGFEETSIRVLLHGKGSKYPEVMMMTTNRDQKKCSSREKLDSSHTALIDISTKLGEKEETNRQSSHQESIGPSKLCSRCPPSTAMRFSKLIENWAPDRFETKLNESEDQERWLLMKVGAKRHRQVSVQASSKGSSSMVWPTAQFLPEAEVHALPFTVPF